MTIGLYMKNYCVNPDIIIGLCGISRQNMSEYFKESIIKAERRHQLEYLETGTSKYLEK